MKKGNNKPVKSTSDQKQRPAAKFNEAKHLYSVPKSRESMVKNALVPRMTRSGKIFDNRRYSTVNNLAKLTIQEEDEDEVEQDSALGMEKLVEIEEEVQQQVMAAEAAEAGTPQMEYGGQEEEVVEEEMQHQVMAPEAAGAGTPQMEYAGQEEVVDGEEVQPNVELTVQIVQEPEEDNIEVAVEEVQTELVTLTLAKSPAKVQDHVKNQQGKRRGQRSPSSSTKKGRKKRRGKALEVHAKLVSPPKLACPGPATSSGSKTVHWADEKENVGLYEVKEFCEEKPRRRCTMFHKVHG